MDPNSKNIYSMMSKEQRAEIIEEGLLKKKKDERLFSLSRVSTTFYTQIPHIFTKKNGRTSLSPNPQSAIFHFFVLFFMDFSIFLFQHGYANEYQAIYAITLLVGYSVILIICCIIFINPIAIKMLSKCVPNNRILTE